MAEYGFDEEDDLNDPNFQPEAPPSIDSLASVNAPPPPTAAQPAAPPSRDPVAEKYGFVDPERTADPAATRAAQKALRDFDAEAERNWSIGGYNSKQAYMDERGSNNRSDTRSPDSFYGGVRELSRGDFQNGQGGRNWTGAGWEFEPAISRSRTAEPAQSRQRTRDNTGDVIAAPQPAQRNGMADFVPFSNAPPIREPTPIVPFSNAPPVGGSLTGGFEPFSNAPPLGGAPFTPAQAPQRPAPPFSPATPAPVPPTGIPRRAEPVFDDDGNIVGWR